MTSSTNSCRVADDDGSEATNELGEVIERKVKLLLQTILSFRD